MKTLSLLLLSVATLFAATTTKPTYPSAGGTSLTVTALNSLANSTSQSVGIWASAFIDNATNQHMEDRVIVKITTGASGVVATGYFAVYFYECISSTTTCTDGMSGSQGTATLTQPTNLVKAGTCNAVAISTAYTCGFSLSTTFGWVPPARWGVVIQNFTGAAFAASGNSVIYDGMQPTNQ